MSVISDIEKVIGIGKGIGQKIGIGGGKERNKGEKDLSDTLDNFESITKGQADNLSKQVFEWIRAGKSDEEIYTRIKDIRGVSQSRTMAKDWKYRLVQRKIDTIRKAVEQSQPPIFNTTGNKQAKAGFSQSGLIKILVVAGTVFALAKFAK